MIQKTESEIIERLYQIYSDRRDFFCSGRHALTMFLEYDSCDPYRNKDILRENWVVHPLTDEVVWSQIKSCFKECIDLEEAERLSSIRLRLFKIKEWLWLLDINLIDPNGDVLVELEKLKDFMSTYNDEGQ